MGEETKGFLIDNKGNIQVDKKIASKDAILSFEAMCMTTNKKINYKVHCVNFYIAKTSINIEIKSFCKIFLKKE